MQSAYLHEEANTSLYACNRYAEDIKLAKFHDCVQLEGLDYLPFVLNLLETGHSFISKVASSIFVLCSCNGTLNSKGELNDNCLSIILYNYLVGPNLHLAYALALIAEFNR